MDGLEARFDGIAGAAEVCTVNRRRLLVSPSRGVETEGGGGKEVVGVETGVE